MKNDDSTASIYFNGCSFMYGIGTSDRQSEIFKSRCSKLISESMQVSEINNAKPGSCNARIFRSTLLDLETISPKLAFIVWSDPLRTEFELTFDDDRTRRENDKYGFDIPQLRANGSQVLNRNHKKYMEIYWGNLESYDRAFLNTLTYMATVSKFSKLYNIPIVQMSYLPYGYRNIDQAIQNHPNSNYSESMNSLKRIIQADTNIYGVFDRISYNFGEIGGLHNVPENDRHPNSAAHLNIAKWFLENYGED